MPIYEYRCPAGHTTERLRKYEERDDFLLCPKCPEVVGTRRIVSAHHQAPDGIYSYEPNVGSPVDFVRKLAALEERRARRGG
jgi:putative FmdB family regulatory protein